MLVNMQLINADKYSASSAVSSYDVNVWAPRGEILDNSGNALFYNELINTLTFNYTEFPRSDEEINKEIFRLISFLTEKGEKWTDELPLIFDENGAIQYK